MRRRTFLLGLGLLVAGGGIATVWSRLCDGSLPVVGALLANWSPAGSGMSAQGRDDGTGSRGPIPLPREMASGGLALEEAIERRRSLRRYSDQPLSLEELSRLLYSAGGITQPRTGFRAAPSAGALYPLELYVVANRAQKLGLGIYHYLPESHALETIREGDFFSNAVAVAALGQAVITQAAVVFVLTAVAERTRAKYRARAERYICLEAGHVGQNVCLAATALGLGSCPVGAFLDEELNHILGLDSSRESAIYLIAVGRVREQS